jgi:hypothetical protein
MKRLAFYFCLVIILLGAMTPKVVHAQAVVQPHITITGNSIAQFMSGFQPHLFPTYLPSNVVINGWIGYTCQMMLPALLATVPANTKVAVLIDSTNDVVHNTRLSDHMTCINQTINTLTMRNPAIKIVVALTPPWVEGNYGCPPTSGYGDKRAVIQSYNAAYRGDAGSGYPGLAQSYPHTVVIADVYSYMVLPNGCANPDLETGPCGIHPGNSQQWSSSWSAFGNVLVQGVQTALLLR